MNWITLQSMGQLEQLKESSYSKPQAIFKHSTRCSISSMAKSRLDRAKQLEMADFHYLDLIAFRTISDEIADTFGVVHESPQVLVIHEGKCIFDVSHNGISLQAVEEALESIRA